MNSSFNADAVWYGLLSSLIIAIGSILCWHHPLGPITVILAFVAVFIIGFKQCLLSLMIIPAVMPIIGLAPWSGWLTFEEFDLLVLALAAGAYLRFALSASKLSKFPSRQCSPISVILILGFSLSVLISMFRGFDDAGGFAFGWFQGYYESMNSIRLAKSFLWALLLLPLWFRACRDDREKAMQLLAAGMAVGLGLASLAALWERLAFTGLLNFSEDYRTTALFWEMHVGGAAFDGFLVLTVPFAFWMLMRSQTRPFLALYGGILALAGYASLTTFSRGVYLAIPLGLAVMAVLSFRQKPSGQSISVVKPAIIPAVALVVFFGFAAYLTFPTSGYRGMLALIISLALVQPVAIAFGHASRQSAWVAFGSASGIALLTSLAVGALPKGAYWVFVVGVVSTVASFSLRQDAAANSKLLLLLSGYFTILAGCILIAAHWGGGAAAESMGWVVPVMLLAVFAGRIRAWPNVTGRWHISLVSILLTVGFVIATFGGGAYMGNRFITSGQDFDARIQHWKGGIDQLDGLDWWLGKGLGRYPATHFFAAPSSEHSGGYRLEASGGESYLLLGGGKHINGWGEIFRVTQRVTPGLAPYKVSFDALAAMPVQLHFEVCEKHLLYNGACVVREISIKAMPGEWQKLTADLQGTPPGRGAWYAPRIVAFSVAVETRGGSVRLDNLILRDGLSSDLLSNGNFADGLAHWFSSSDKHHMPWHMKSMFFHTLFDQGLIGLAVFLLMIFAAIFRLAVGNAQTHPLAPVIVGSVSGFLVVGLFDSLIDVPRLAALFYFLLILGLTIRMPAQKQQSRQKQHPDRSMHGA